MHQHWPPPWPSCAIVLPARAADLPKKTRQHHSYRWKRHLKGNARNRQRVVFVSLEDEIHQRAIVSSELQRLVLTQKLF
jgi:hypothetical protein